MKKSLIALAVAGAFSGAAFAQSSVTLYGRVDVGLQKTNDPTGASSLSGAVNNDGLNVVQGSGSRLGFMGSEDLGGGMKALFQIEHRFTPDDGNAASPFWAGRSYVGLAGPFGTVKLGREYTPAFWVGLFADPWGYDTIAQLGTATLANSSAVRFANVVNYKSPSFGGFSFELAYVPSEVNSTPAVGDKDGFGASATFSAGPLFLGLGYEDNVQANSGNANTKLTNFTATYQIGIAKLFGNYARGTSELAGSETKRTNWAVGTAITVGAGEVRAGMTQLKTDNPTGSDPKLTKIGLGYHHNLSKRTTLYVDYGRAKQSNPDLKTRSGFDAGIKHNF